MVGLLDDSAVFVLVLISSLNEVLCPQVYLMEGKRWKLLSGSDRIVSQDPIDEVLKQLLPGDHVLKGGGKAWCLEMTSLRLDGPYSPGYMAN